MPTKKNPEIEKLLASIAGISRQDAEAQRICVCCRGPVVGFKDDLS